MSLGIVAVCPGLVVCASDRRLTRIGADENVRVKDVFREGSTKLTYLQCQNAVALIGYVGIGEYQTRTPSDWLMSLAETVKIAQMPFLEALTHVALAAEKEIAAIPASFDRRHSFYAGALAEGHPMIALVSNFQNLNEDCEKSEPTKDLEISWSAPRQPDAALTVVGATETVTKADRSDVFGRMRKNDSTMSIRARCVKIIKDAEYRRRSKGRRGTSGTSVTWGVIESGKGCQVGVEVPGGTSVQELPNQIFPTMLFKAPFIDIAPGPKFRSRFNPARRRSSSLIETLCPHCGGTVLEGYFRCGLCDRPLQRG